MSLKEEFTDSDYRRAYAESFANTIIATQIRLLRGSMTQQAFADLVGVKQSRVSAMEDENYSMWSTKSLKKLAAAKDVVFLGRFVSFGELLNWSRSMSEDSLKVPSFSDDPVFTIQSSTDSTMFGSAGTSNNLSVTQQAGTSAPDVARQSKTIDVRGHAVSPPVPAKASLMKTPNNLAA